MKFRLKITLSMLSLLSLLFGICGSLLIGISFHTALEREKESAVSSYQMLLNTLSVVGQMGDWTGIQQANVFEPWEYSDGRGIEEITKTLEQLQRQGIANFSAIRLSKEGEALYEWGEATAGFQEQLALAESDLPQTQDMDMVQCLIAEFGQKDRQYLQLSSDEEVFYVNGQPIVFDVAYEISTVYAARAQQQSTYHWIFVVMVAACSVLAYTASWFLTRPLTRLSKASRELAQGNLSFRTRIRSGDEIGQLAEDFDTMAAQVEESFSALQAAMARQERFMGSFAHELKTPMTSIIGYADLIRSQTLSTEEEMDAAHYIFSEGKRLESLSLKLLEILVNQREDAVPFRKASPARLINQLVEQLRPAYEQAGITLCCHCEEGLCYLEPDLVKSLLVNLLDNARKSIRAGGGVIALTCEMTAVGCQIHVADNGKGIPAEALKHLTEAFYRVDQSRARAQGGVGLGLTLCAKIVDLHQGRMAFESKEGQGTHVTITLEGGRL